MNSSYKFMQVCMRYLLNATVQDVLFAVIARNLAL